jgi:glyoxylase-like metal-dependent hydrolase (beta-lactamase superfamily II)
MGVNSLTSIENIVSRHFTLEEVCDGVYAAISVAGYGAMGNAGIVDMGNYALVFDTFNTQQAAEDLKRAAEELTGHHVQYVINSHWHGDHIRGNQVFSSSIIISSTRTYELIKTLNPERIKRQKALLPRLDEDIETLKKRLETETVDQEDKQQLLQQISFLKEIGLSLPNLRLTLPSLIFECGVALYGTAREVRLVSLGSAHTRDDTILYIPEERIIFAGDIISIENHPMLTDGDPENWIRVLDQLEDMDITTIVPGHGPVGNKSSLKFVREYIQELIKIIDESISQGNSRDYISTIAMPELFSRWKADSIFYQNLLFLYNTKTQ